MLLERMRIVVCHILFWCCCTIKRQTHLPYIQITRASLPQHSDFELRRCFENRCPLLVAGFGGKMSDKKVQFPVQIYRRCSVMYSSDMYTLSIQIIYRRNADNPCSASYLVIHSDQTTQEDCMKAVWQACCQMLYASSEITISERSLAIGGEKFGGSGSLRVGALPVVASSFCAFPHFTNIHVWAATLRFLVCLSASMWDILVARVCFGNWNLLTYTLGFPREN